MGYGWKKISSISLGTGTAEQDFTTLKAPEWAGRLLGISVAATVITPSVDESLMAKGRLTSEDLAVEPCEFLFPATGAADATTTIVGAGQRAWYPLNVPLNGGDSLNFHATALVANAAAPYANIDCLFADNLKQHAPTALDGWPGVQRFSKVSALGASTANGTTTGSSFTVTSASRLLNTFGILSRDTAAPSSPALGYWSLDSSGFGQFSPVQFHAEILPAFLNVAIGGGAPIKVSQADQNFAMSATSVITPLYTQEGGVNNTTEDWIVGIQFSRLGA